MLMANSTAVAAERTSMTPFGGAGAVPSLARETPPATGSAERGHAMSYDRPNPRRAGIAGEHVHERALAYPAAARFVFGSAAPR